MKWKELEETISIYNIIFVFSFQYASSTQQNQSYQNSEASILQSLHKSLNSFYIVTDRNRKMNALHTRVHQLNKTTSVKPNTLEEFNISSTIAKPHYVTSEASVQTKTSRYTVSKRLHEPRQTSLSTGMATFSIFPLSAINTVKSGSSLLISSLIKTRSSSTTSQRQTSFVSLSKQPAIHTKGVLKSLKVTRDPNRTMNAFHTRVHQLNKATSEKPSTLQELSIYSASVRTITSSYTVTKSLHEPRQTSLSTGKTTILKFSSDAISTLTSASSIFRISSFIATRSYSTTSQRQTSFVSPSKQPVIHTKGVLKSLNVTRNSFLKLPNNTTSDILPSFVSNSSPILLIRSSIQVSQLQTKLTFHDRTSAVNPQTTLEITSLLPEISSSGSASGSLSFDKIMSSKLTSYPSKTISLTAANFLTFIISGKLNETFTKDLNDMNSAAFIILSQRLNQEFDARFGSLGMRKSIVKKFSAGSVLFDAELHFDSLSNVDSSSISEDFRGNNMGITDIQVTGPLQVTQSTKLGLRSHRLTSVPLPSSTSFIPSKTAIHSLQFQTTTTILFNVEKMTRSFNLKKSSTLHNTVVELTGLYSLSNASKPKPTLKSIYNESTHYYSKDVPYITEFPSNKTETRLPIGFSKTPFHRGTSTFRHISKSLLRTVINITASTSVVKKTSAFAVGQSAFSQLSITSFTITDKPNVSISTKTKETANTFSSYFRDRSMNRSSTVIPSDVLIKASYIGTSSPPARLHITMNSNLTPVHSYSSFFLETTPISGIELSSHGPFNSVVISTAIHATPVVVVDSAKTFSISGKLKENFTDDLNDETSAAFKSLSLKLTNQFKQSLGSNGLAKSEILKFSEGSVIFYGNLFFTSASTLDEIQITSLLNGSAEITDIKVTESCSKSTCGNSSTGTCIDNSGSAVCMCKQGFSGKRCMQKATVNGTKYDVWTEWSECSKTCNNGTRNRTRVCLPIPMNGGTCLLGPHIDIESEFCNAQNCKIISDDDDDDFVMALIICGAVFFIIILILIFFCCYKRKEPRHEMYGGIPDNFDQLKIRKVHRLPKRPYRYHDDIDKYNVIPLNFVKASDFNDSVIENGTIVSIESDGQQESIEEIYQRQLKKFLEEAPRFSSTAC